MESTTGEPGFTGDWSINGCLYSRISHACEHTLCTSYLTVFQRQRSDTQINSDTKYRFTK